MSEEISNKWKFEIFRDKDTNKYYSILTAPNLDFRFLSPEFISKEELQSWVDEAIYLLREGYDLDKPLPRVN